MAVWDKSTQFECGASLEGQKNEEVHGGRHLQQGKEYLVVGC